MSTYAYSDELRGVFLIRETAGQSKRLDVHSLEAIGPAARQALRNKLTAAESADVRFVRHNSRQLRAARSFESMDRQMGGGAIVYDPTGIFARAASLVDCARALRKTAGAKIDKVLFDSGRRTLYVILADAAFHGTHAPFRAEVAETMNSVARTFDAWRKTTSQDFEIAVRVGFEPPAHARVVAVDTKSRPGHVAEAYASGLAFLKSRAGAATVGAVAIATPSAAMAGDGGDNTAAVAQTNFTALVGTSVLTPSGGFPDTFHVDGGGEFAMPLGHDFGLQAEGGGGSFGYWGVGGHLFWRDPDSALLGGFISHESMQGREFTRYGGEAELYFTDITLSGRAGYQDGNVPRGGYGRFDLTFYATPNFSLRAGFDAQPSLFLGRAGLEYQPAPDSWSGLSLFVDANAGATSQVMAGLKLHFGEPGMSLLYRDRHEDPPNLIYNFTPFGHGHHHYTPPT